MYIRELYSYCLVIDKFHFDKVFVDMLQVIIDSQPLTVAILASLLFGESIEYVGAAGLVLGVIGLLLLEVITPKYLDSTILSPLVLFPF